MKRAVNRKTCERLITKWRGILGLSHNWKIDVKTYESKDETPEDERDRAAWVFYEDACYYDALITVNLWADECKDDLESVITHEMLHLVLAPLATAAQEAMASTPNMFEMIDETTVTSLELAFQRVRRRA